MKGAARNLCLFVGKPKIVAEPNFRLSLVTFVLVQITLCIAEQQADVGPPFS